MSEKELNEVCIYHGQQTQCTKILDDKIKQHIAEIKKIDEESRRAERDAHRRMDRMEKEFNTTLSTALREQHKEATTELKETVAKLNSVVGELKIEFGGRLNGRDKQHDDDVKEINQALRIKDEAIKNKVGFKLFLTMVLAVLACIGGLYTWQYVNTKDMFTWQKCVSSELQSKIDSMANVIQIKIDGIKDTVNEISGVATANSIMSSRNRDDIKRQDEDTKQWRKELLSEIKAVRQAQDKHERKRGDDSD